GALAAVLATRLAFPAIVGRPTRILVVGSGAQARELGDVARTSDDLFEVAGFIEPASRTGERQGGAADLEAVLTAARGVEATVVVVARDERRGVVPVQALVRCRMAGLEVLEAQTFVERAHRRIPVEWI